MKLIRTSTRLISALWLSSIGFGASADAPPTPATRSPEVEQSLGDAKKDFEMLKSLREHGTEAKGDSSRLALPRMPNGPAPAASPLVRPERMTDPKSKGANWLVDAMQKREPGKTGRADERRDDLQNRDDRGSTDTDNLPLPAEKERKGRESAPNPFTPYMQDWISPVDMALLRPALEQARRVTSGNITGDATDARIRLEGGREEFGIRSDQPLLPAKAPSGLTGGQPRGNPYLDILEKGPFTASGPAPAPRPSVALPNLPSAAHTSLGPPPNPAPLPQSRIPEFVRPSTDDKYFKPLKRF